MDKSEQYIKMCDCEKIQVPHWRKGWKEGDYFWDKEKVCLCGMDYLVIKDIFLDDRNYVRFAMREPLTAVVYEQPLPTSTMSIKEGEYEIHTLCNALWLPRQDQLQKMVKEDGETDLEILADFSYGMIEFSSKYGGTLKFTSMEQLWLAFVMKEKYNKTWDGEKWI